MQPYPVEQAVLKRPWVVLLVMLALVGPTLAFSLLQPTVYEASARLLVGVVEERQKPGPGLDLHLLSAQNVEGLQQMELEVVEAVPTRPVAEEVIQRLGLRMEPAQLLENLRVEEVPGTMFVRLSYQDANPERAQRIANTVAEVASEKIRPEVPFASFCWPFECHLRIQVWGRAAVPETPVSPKPVRNALVALGVGLMVGTGLALLLEQRAA